MIARTVLIADEDFDTRVILRTVLERSQFAVVEATSSEDAAAVALKESFDLIILNHPMADRSGNSLARVLRTVEKTRYVPILNLTSRVVPQFLQQATNDGVSMTLAKPIDVENIMQVVNELLQKSEVQIS